MAAANVLTVGDTAADSSDQTVAAGTPVLYCLKDASGPTVPAGARVNVLVKDDAGEYFSYAALTKSSPNLLIEAPGTYRFSRPAGISCGVFSA